MHLEMDVTYDIDEKIQALSYFIHKSHLVIVLKILVRKDISQMPNLGASLIILNLMESVRKRMFLVVLMILQEQ